MKKLMIAKGEVATYNSLITDTLVVDGILKISGLLRARNIQGAGIVEARRLEAESANVRIAFVNDLDVGDGVFEKLYGSNCRASDTLTVTDFIQALDVRAKRLVIDRSNIGNCAADEIVSSRRRSALGTALSGLLRLIFAPVRRLCKAGRKHKAAQAAPAPVPPDQSEARPGLQFDIEAVAAVLDALEEKGYTVLRPAVPDGLPAEDAA